MKYFGQKRILKKKIQKMKYCFCVLNEMTKVLQKYFLVVKKIDVLTFPVVFVPEFPSGKK